jgi:ferrous iron transport protein A
MHTGISTTLDMLSVGERATVIKVLGEGAIKRRIMDMGITKGTSIYIEKVAPLGDPLELVVRGYNLSIRRADAANILVETYIKCGNCHGHRHRRGFGHRKCHGKKPLKSEA